MKDNLFCVSFNKYHKQLCSSNKPDEFYGYNVAANDGKGKFTFPDKILNNDDEIVYSELLGTDFPAYLKLRNDKTLLSSLDKQKETLKDFSKFIDYLYYHILRQYLINPNVELTISGKKLKVSKFVIRRNPEGIDPFDKPFEDEEWLGKTRRTVFLIYLTDGDLLYGFTLGALRALKDDINSLILLKILGKRDYIDLEINETNLGQYKSFLESVIIPANKQVLTEYQKQILIDKNGILSQSSNDPLSRLFLRTTNARQYRNRGNNYLGLEGKIELMTARQFERVSNAEVLYGPQYIKVFKKDQFNDFVKWYSNVRGSLLTEIEKEKFKYVYYNRAWTVAKIKTGFDTSTNELNYILNPVMLEYRGKLELSKDNSSFPDMINFVLALLRKYGGEKYSNVFLRDYYDVTSPNGFTEYNISKSMFGRSKAETILKNIFITLNENLKKSGDFKGINLKDFEQFTTSIFNFLTNINSKNLDSIRNKIPLLKLFIDKFNEITKGKYAILNVYPDDDISKLNKDNTYINFVYELPLYLFDFSYFIPLEVKEELEKEVKIINEVIELKKKNTAIKKGSKKNNKKSEKSVVKNNTKTNSGEGKVVVEPERKEENINTETTNEKQNSSDVEIISVEEDPFAISSPVEIDVLSNNNDNQETEIILSIIKYLEDLDYDAIIDENVASDLSEKLQIDVLDIMNISSKLQDNISLIDELRNKFAELYEATKNCLF